MSELTAVPHCSGNGGGRMNRLAQAARQRQRILDALADGTRTMVELRTDTGMSNQRLAQLLLRMTDAKEVARTRDGKRPDGQPCYAYRAAVSETITAGEIGARLAANVNGGGHNVFVRPAARKLVVRLFGGLHVPAQS